MIARMLKAYVVARAADREALLAALAELGVVHLTPVDPARAVPDEHAVAAAGAARRALQILGAVEPTGSRLGLSAAEAVDEIIGIQRRSAEMSHRLSALHHEVEQVSLWGDVRLEQFEQLRQSGIDVQFFSVPRADVDAAEAEVVQPLTELPGKQMLVAVINRSGELQLPDTATPVPLPKRDRPTVRAEAAEIDASLKADAERLCRLAHLKDNIRKHASAMEEQLTFSLARKGALAGENLFAVQGWVPKRQAEALPNGLTAIGLDVAVTTAEPTEDDEPPTLVEYPKWARPIQGLFSILGTLPGYREMDLSPFFMIALPLFAAMLIGDAGYGLLFVLVPALTYRKAVAAAGKPGVHLLIVMGIATMIWGVLTGAFFGVTPQNLINTGGACARIGNVLHACQVIRGDAQEQAYIIMKISFVIAAVHLSLAQLRQAIDVAPRLEMLSKVGWAIFLWGIFLVIWYLFFQSQAGRRPHWLTMHLLVGGAAMAIIFASPDRNPLKMVGKGLAQFPLTALSAFSDSISYIRLMGVGLASTIIGQTFNQLGANVADAATWFAGAFVVLFGHGLNIAMCMIAILAHGVRLNMLEFSSNAGVQWAGYAYEPFAVSHQKEQ